MTYLERLRADGAKKVLARVSPLSKLTEPGFVSSAATPPPPKTLLQPVSPAAFTSAQRKTIIAARDAAGLDEWRAALTLGRLRLCGNCSRYTFGPDPTGSGTCGLHGDGLLAFAMPFDCADFEGSSGAK